MKPFKKYLYEELLATLLSADVRDVIKRKGGKIYQIGGAVRDEILGKVSCVLSEYEKYSSILC